MPDDFTPSTEQVRQGYADDPAAEYADPVGYSTKWGEQAFDRWLTAHDAEVKATALEEAANDMDEVPGGREVHVPWLRARAAEIRKEATR